MKRLFFIFALPTALLLYGIAAEAPIQLDDGPVLDSARTIHHGARWLGFTSFWFTHKGYLYSWQAKDLRAPEKAIMTRMANQAIAAGPR